MTEKIEQLQKEDKRAEATKWNNRLVKFQDAVALTKSKVQTRLDKLKSQGRHEKLREVENVFAQAELIGMYSLLFKMVSQLALVDYPQAKKRWLMRSRNEND